MIDEEFLCGWMEPKPDRADSRSIAHFSPKGWWYWHNHWEPIAITLNEAFQIEAKLTDEQWSLYAHHLCAGYDFEDIGLVLYRDWIHSTAAAKIKALAAVLRGAK